MFQRKKFQQTAITSAKLDKIKIMQWNRRGLSKKSELLVFSEEKDIENVCLNEVNSWHNQNLIDEYFVVTETRANKSHITMIIAN